MSQQLNELLHEPPVMDALVEETENGQQLTPTWESWFTNNRNVINQFFPITTLQDVTNGTRHIAVSQVTKLSTADRDTLLNVDDGSIIYNTTTSKFNFREGGVWTEAP